MELKKLQYKHEASILHNTSRLMLNDLIYSGLDGVLVALNGGKKRKVRHIPHAHTARTSESIVSSLLAPYTEEDVLHSLFWASGVQQLITLHLLDAALHAFSVG